MTDLNVQVIVSAAVGQAKEALDQVTAAETRLRTEAATTTAQAIAGARARGAASAEEAKANAENARQTLAAIEAARAEAVQNLETARSRQAMAQASLRAAEAAGAQPSALRAVREAEAEATVAAQGYSAALTELARLGAAQTRINADLAISEKIVADAEAQATRRAEERAAAAEASAQAQRDELASAAAREALASQPLSPGERQRLEAGLAEYGAARAAGTESRSSYTPADVASIYNQIDPVAKKLDNLDALESRLQALNAAGAIGADDFAHLSEKLAESRAALSGAEAGAKGAKDALEGFSLTSGMAAREYGILAGELARGNYTRLEGSIVTLSNRIGILPLLFSSTGAALAALTAGIGVFVAGLIGGELEDSRFNRALVATNDYAGETLGGIRELAAGMAGGVTTIGQAKDALLAVVGSGRFTRDELKTVGQAAVDMAAVTGTSVDKAVAVFEKLKASPVATLKQLDDQYHFLTPTIYDEITALEKQGDAEAAAELAVKTWAGAVRTAADQASQNLGIVERVWNALKRAASDAKDAVLSIGRQATPQDQLAEAQRQRDYFINGNGGLAAVQANPQLAAQLALVDQAVQAAQAKVDQANASADAKAQQDKVNQAFIQGADYIDKLTGSLDKAARKQQELTKATEALQAIYKANPNDPRLAGITFTNGQPGGEGYDKIKAEIEAQFGGGRASGGGVGSAINGQLADVRAKLAEAQASLKAQLASGQIDYADYFQRLGDSETAAIDREIALRRTELAAAQAQVAKLGNTSGADAARGRASGIQSQIDALESQRQQREQAIAQQRAQLEQRTDQQILVLREQLYTAQGDTASAAMARIEDQFQQSMKRMIAAGSQEGMLLAEKLFNAEAAKAQIDGLLKQAKDIAAKFNLNKQNLANEVQIGSLTPQAAQAALSTSQNSARGQLDGLIQQAQGLHSTLGVQLVQDLEKIKAGVVGVKSPFDQIFKTLSGGILSATTTFFDKVISGTATFRNALGGLFDSIAQSLYKLAAQILAQKALQSVLGLFGAQLGGNGQVTSTGAGFSGSLVGSAASYISTLFAGGGAVTGPGTETSDSIPARLSNGEYVLRASVVRALGVRYLDALNGGTLNAVPAFASGGYVGLASSSASAAQRIAGGAAITVSAPVTVNTDSGADPTSSAQQGRQLGVAIKQAIQREIVHQQRPGGLLHNPSYARAG